MGFFDRILRGGRIRTTPAAGREPDAPGKRPAHREEAYEPGIVCELEIEGRKYIMRSLELDLDKAEMSGGRPVRIRLVFDERPDKRLEGWIMSASHRKDGTVKFFRNTDSLAEGAIHSFSFHGALCTGYRKSVAGITPVTELLLQTKYINLSGEEYMVR